MLRQDYVERSGPHEDEVELRIIPEFSATDKILVPVGNMFLKHYYYLSFEEYMLQKASNRVDAEGTLNINYLYSQEIWAAGNYSGTRFTNLGAAHTAAMAAKVRASLEANTEKNPLVEYTCLRFWAKPSLARRRNRVRRTKRRRA